MIRELTLPLARDEAASLRAGDLVTLTGPVKRVFEGTIDLDSLGVVPE